MTGWELPQRATIGGKTYDIHTDYRNILEIFSWLQAEAYPEFLRWRIALALFYEQEIPDGDFAEAGEYFRWFVCCGQEEEKDPGPKLLDWEADAQVIVADGNLLARLFDNLINNAIKYGAEGKKVLVKVQAEEEIVTVSVTNYGYVIPADELPLIFNKFYRVEQSRSTTTGGTGLGLAIAKSIVDMHGGTIAVASDLNGTVFTVKLKVNFDVNRENFRAIG